MSDHLYIPESLRGSTAAIRPPTPLADELERRLADMVARLEAQMMSGRHPVAGRLARVIALIRKAEATLSGVIPNVPDDRIRKAREITAWTKAQLDRKNLTSVLADVTDRLGRN